MKIIITGDQGLIGSFLEKRLRKEGNKIVGKIDLKGGKPLFQLKKLRLKKKVDLLIHSAAFCKINKTIENPELAHIHNSAGTFHVLEFCRRNKIPKILFFSSSRVLGKEKNPYTASKNYGEELCKAYEECYGIKYLIIRPSTVYGPFWDSTSRIIHLYILAAFKNKPLRIFGNPKTKTLDFTYIDDFIEGVMIALKGKWNREYNISGREEYRVYDLAKIIIKETKSASKILVKKAEIAQPQKVRVNISKLKRIGYSPKVSLEEGIRRTIKWYKSLLEKNPFLLNNI